MLKQKSRSKKLIILILTATLIFSLISGCGPDKGEEIVNNPDITQKVDKKNIGKDSPLNEIESKTIDVAKQMQEYDEELAEIHTLPDDYTEPLENSYDKIQKAFSNGTINKEETAKLCVLAEYAPDKLPEEYKSDQPPVSAQFEIKYLFSNWDSISQATKDAVEPYLLPLNEPKSVFSSEYLEANPDDDTPLQSGFSLFPKVESASPRYTTILNPFNHDGQSFTILYTEDSKWSKQLKGMISKMESTVEGAIKHSWDKFVPLMKVKPSSPYLIELVVIKSSKPNSTIYGEEWFDGKYYRIRVSLLIANDLDMVKTTTAHELFHSFQDELNIGFDKVDEKWLCEATAVWSENFAYEKLNKEHDYHSDFFKTLHKERIDFDGDFEYNSYMLFYYLTEYAKVDFIQDIIATAGKKGNSSIRPYLEKNIPKRKETYSKFALYNWNRQPVKKYFDHGNIKGSPNGKCLKKKHMGAHEEDPQKVSLECGAIQYYYYTFDQKDKELQHVVVTFDHLIEDDEYIKRQALLKVGGEWKVEDLSAVKEKKYCYRRKSQNEKVEALVLVYSNSSFESSMIDIDSFEVRTEGCPKEMELIVTAKYELSNNDNFKWTAEANFTETLEIFDHCLFLVKDADYNFSGEGYLDGKKLIVSSGSLSYNVEKPDYKNTLSRILKNTTENIKGAKEAYKQFGISDNIPPEGIFITIPAMLKNPVGSTTIYLPDPVGTQSFPDPLIFDGLSQIIAITPTMGEWNSDGISIRREIDQFSHKCPITEAFSLDANKLSEQLKSIQNTMPQNMPDVSEMPDFENMPGMDQLGDLELGDMDEQLNPGAGGADLSGLNSLIEVINVMTEDSTSASANGYTAKVKLEIDGVYTKYYED